MTTPHHFPSNPDSLEGRVFRPANMAELAEAIEQAFDYRGDVTLELADGRTIEGYVFNRQTTGDGVLQIFPKLDSSVRHVPYGDIVTISFSGKDTASGNSWEAWVTKKEAQRRAEAEQSAAEARARGHL
jgi:hypothetical protein